MSIKDIFNSLEATLVQEGFPLVDTDEVPQGKRATIRITEIPGDQAKRGTIGAGVIRISFAIEVVLIYAVGSDKRIERKVAEEAERVIAAIYNDVNLTNHHFIGASISRDARLGVVTNAMRFDFQSQATL